MFVQYLLGGGFHLGHLALVVGPFARFGLAGVGRQLDAVDGEHLAPDESLPVADHQDLGKELGHRVAQAGDERGQRREVRLAVARDGDEQDILAARRLHLAAADDATAVGQQYDLDERGGIEGGGAFEVVLVTGMEVREVELVIDQVAKRVFKTAGEHLPVEIDGQKLQSFVNRFIARHFRHRLH